MTKPKTPKADRSKDHAQTRAPSRTAAIAATGVLGALAAGVFGALKLGWLDGVLDRARSAPSSEGAEHAVPDLAADAPTPGTDRAPVAFRPDPTAPVTDAEREALRPATGAPPTLAAQRGEMANQTGAANG